MDAFGFVAPQDLVTVFALLGWGRNERLFFLWQIFWGFEFDPLFSGKWRVAQILKTTC